MSHQVYDKAAAALWQETKADWHVCVHHTLTEPTCPYITISSDDPELPRDTYIGESGGDINADIKAACEKMLLKLREGK